ncbi:hypothetical protein FRC12_007347 [Ceratobasidium sp. 428]|nr:hypothetical protein FRC12_007347 [Ceratobasidium sp. 428]
MIVLASSTSTARKICMVKYSDIINYGPAMSHAFPDYQNDETARFSEVMTYNASTRFASPTLAE